jgi:hypothetical protein
LYFTEQSQEADGKIVTLWILVLKNDVLERVHSVHAKVKKRAFTYMVTGIRNQQWIFGRVFYIGLKKLCRWTRQIPSMCKQYRALPQCKV